MSATSIVKRSALGNYVVIVAPTQQRADALAKEISAPTVGRMAGNVMKAARRVVQAVVRGEPVRVTADVLAERTAKCQECPAWDGAARMGLGRCNDARCGCTGFKRELATERCPRKMW